MDPVRRSGFFRPAAGLLLGAVGVATGRLVADSLNVDRYEVVEARQPDGSVELRIQAAPTETPVAVGAYREKLQTDPAYLKREQERKKRERSLLLCSSRKEAEAFVHDHILHAVVEVEKDSSRRHIVRQEPADASRDPKEGKKGGTERIVAMFRDGAEARSHAKRLDRAKTDPKQKPDSSQERGGR